MDLIKNCTLVFDIDAIVLHTNSNAMGKKNHVSHIVNSPFLMFKYTIYMCQSCYMICVSQVILGFLNVSITAVACPPFTMKHV